MTLQSPCKIPEEALATQLDTLPKGTHILLNESHDTPFSSWVDSCGHISEKGVYHWDGLKRLRQDRAVIQYTLRGHGRLEYEGQRFDVRPGQAMLIHYPHEHRYWLPAEESEWTFLYATLEGPNIVKLWKWLTARVGPVVDLNPDSPPITLLCEIIRRASLGLIRNDFQSADWAHRLFFGLSNELLGSPDSTEHLPEEIRAVINFCRGNYNRNISIEEMAEVSGYSQGRFSKVFKQYTSQTPRNFLEHFRLEQACSMLVDTNSTVKDIAYRSGFSDPNYFAKVFRKKLNLSPLEYRDAHKTSS